VGRGWIAAEQIERGECRLGAEGQQTPVRLVDGPKESTLAYNLEIEEYHTYLVGSALWGFSAWAHNADYASRAATAANHPEVAYRSLNEADVSSIEPGGGIARTNGRSGVKARADLIGYIKQDTNYIAVTEDSAVLQDTNNYITFRTSEVKYISQKELLQVKALMRELGERSTSSISRPTASLSARSLAVP